MGNEGARRTTFRCAASSASVLVVVALLAVGLLWPVSPPPAADGISPTPPTAEMMGTVVAPQATGGAAHVEAMTTMTTAESHQPSPTPAAVASASTLDPAVAKALRLRAFQINSTAPPFENLPTLSDDTDVRAALRYRRQCGFVRFVDLPERFDMLHAVVPNDADHRDRREALWAARLERCRGAGTDFLDNCEGLRGTPRGAKRPTSGAGVVSTLLSPRSAGPRRGVWYPDRLCAWSSAVLPFRISGKLFGALYPSTTLYNRCSQRRRCTCWVFSPDVTTTQRPQRGGGALVDDPMPTRDLPRLSSAFRSKAWVRALLLNTHQPTSSSSSSSSSNVTDSRSTSDGPSTESLLLPPPLRGVLLQGTSHARRLFFALSSAVAEVFPLRPQLVYPNPALEHAVLFVATAIGGNQRLYRPVVVFTGSASPSKESFELWAEVLGAAVKQLRDDLMRHRNFTSSDRHHLYEVAEAFEPQLVVINRGMWDIENSDEGPALMHATHVRLLLDARRAFPAAAIFTYPPHFVHTNRGGCLSALRQVAFRDALACAVADANAILNASGPTALRVFDVFDMTASRRVTHQSPAGQEASRASTDGPPPFEITSSAAQQRGKRSKNALPEGQNRLLLRPVGDGHHFGAPVMMNVALRLLLQFRRVLPHLPPSFPAATTSDSSGKSAAARDHQCPLPAERTQHPVYESELAGLRSPALPREQGTCRRCVEGSVDPGGSLFADVRCVELRLKRVALQDALEAVVESSVAPSGDKMMPLISTVVHRAADAWYCAPGLMGRLLQGFQSLMWRPAAELVAEIRLGVDIFLTAQRYSRVGGSLAALVPPVRDLPRWPTCASLAGMASCLRNALDGPSFSTSPESGLVLSDLASATVQQGSIRVSSSGPSLEWTVEEQCVWQTATRLFLVDRRWHVQLIERNLLRRPGQGVDSNASSSSSFKDEDRRNVSCWVHPRLPASLYTSRQWTRDHLLFSEGVAGRGKTKKPDDEAVGLAAATSPWRRRWLFIGTSHMRILFATLGSVLNDTVRPSPTAAAASGGGNNDTHYVQHTHLSDLSDHAALTDSRTGETLGAFVPSPTIATEALIEGLSGAGSGPMPAAEVTDVVMNVGVWELLNIGFVASRLRREMAAALVGLRKAFPRATVVLVLPSLMLNPAVGCLAPTRQRVLREALLAAVATAAVDDLSIGGARIVVADAFDLSWDRDISQSDPTTQRRRDSALPVATSRDVPFVSFGEQRDDTRRLSYGDGIHPQVPFLIPLVFSLLQMNMTTIPMTADTEVVNRSSHGGRRATAVPLWSYVPAKGTAKGTDGSNDVVVAMIERRTGAFDAAADAWLRARAPPRGEKRCHHCFDEPGLTSFRHWWCRRARAREALRCRARVASNTTATDAGIASTLDTADRAAWSDVAKYVNGGHTSHSGGEVVETLDAAVLAGQEALACLNSQGAGSPRGI